MSLVAIVIAVLLSDQAVVPQTTQTATQQLAPPAPAEELTPAQQRARTRVQAEQVCSRRAPTGRRLEQTTCISREMAAARARAGREHHESVLQAGWQQPEEAILNGGPK